MEIENVFAIARQLQGLGFGDLSGQIAKQICFHPEVFTVVHTIEYDEADIRFQIVVGKDAALQYALRYFDAAIVETTQFFTATGIGIDPVDLDVRMSELNWRNAFDFNNATALNPANKAGWANEEKIDAVIKDLRTLENSAEGKALAAHLKAKHWRNDATMESGVVKRKPEISQRFHLTENKRAITLDEACRFLTNCRIEKQINEQRKGRPLSGESPGQGAANGSNLLKKRRSWKGIKGKRQQRDDK